MLDWVSGDWESSGAVIAEKGSDPVDVAVHFHFQSAGLVDQSLHARDE